MGVRACNNPDCGNEYPCAVHDHEGNLLTAPSAPERDAPESIADMIKAWRTPVASSIPRLESVYNACADDLEEKLPAHDAQIRQSALREALAIAECNAVKPGDIIETEGNMQTFIAGMNASMQRIYKAILALMDKP